MEDQKIIALYHNRDESAITETDRKYGVYCRTIAMNILSVREDAEECVNDTYLGVWNAVPPARPGVFSAFIARITRNLAMNLSGVRTILRMLNKLNVKESEYMPLIKETSVENNIDENENILKTKRRGRKPKLSN